MGRGAVSSNRWGGGAVTGGEAAGPAGSDEANRDDVDGPDTAPIPLPPASPFTPFSWTATSTTSVPEGFPPGPNRDSWASQLPETTSIGRTPPERTNLPATGNTPFRREERFGVEASPFALTPPSGRRRRRHLVLAIAAAAVIIAAAVVTVVVNQGDGGQDDTTRTANGHHHRDDAAESKLRGLLPPGYEPSACTPGDPEGAATATIQCAANSDASGPRSATFSLFGDAADLRAAFAETTAANSVVECPGRIQSPGPWRRNSAPQQPAGDLVCALDTSHTPIMAWTSTRDLLLARIAGEVPTTPLSDLYAWWATHS